MNTTLAIFLSSPVRCSWKGTALRAALFAAAMGLTSGTAHGQTATTCPAALPVDTQCYGGQDDNGAFYLVAIPANWNGMLVVHAHGGPNLGAPTPQRATEDLTRWAITVKEGFAWAGSTYRRGGYGVRMAAEDTENLRRIFFEAFPRPTLTLVHGQSFGANVAAKVIELYNDGDVPNYDGALITSGVIGPGGTHNYLFRADLRAVYQYYCRNHPRPDEPSYPLWMGLPLDSTLTSAQLRDRINECTGHLLPASRRTAQQQQNLTNILNVIRIPERTLGSHLDFATFTFRDLVMLRLGGRSPFSNWDVQYSGSTNDAALNEGVERFEADKDAVLELAYDSNLTGKISIPVLTLHAIDDPTAFVEAESAYRKVLERANTGDQLLQAFTNEGQHSFLQQPEYAALFRQLVRWVETGDKPALSDIVADCTVAQATYGEACLFNVDYRPQPFFARTYPRSFPAEDSPPVEFRVSPCVLDLTTPGTFEGVLTVPEGFDLADWGVSDLQAEGATALYSALSSDGRNLIATFDKGDLLNVVAGKAVVLTLTGTFNRDGQRFLLVTSATVRVVGMIAVEALPAAMRQPIRR